MLLVLKLPLASYYFFNINKWRFIRCTESPFVYATKNYFCFIILSTSYFVIGQAILPTKKVKNKAS